MNPSDAVQKSSGTSKTDLLRRHLAEGKKIYVSVTGLSLKQPWHIFQFIRNAVPSKIQSDKSEGNLFSETRNLKGVKHTLTFWTSRKAMLGFAYSGRHHAAIKVFSKFFTGVTYGYESDTAPTWDEALLELQKHGKVYAVKAQES